MPGIFLALTIVSGLSFALALTWVIIQWVRADRESDRAERELEERMGRGAKPKAAPLQAQPERS